MSKGKGARDGRERQWWALYARLGRLLAYVEMIVALDDRADRISAEQLRADLYYYAGCARHALADERQLRAGLAAELMLSQCTDLGVTVEEMLAAARAEETGG